MEERKVGELRPRASVKMSIISTIDGDRGKAMVLKVLSITQDSVKRKGFVISREGNYT